MHTQLLCSKRVNCRLRFPIQLTPVLALFVFLLASCEVVENGNDLPGFDPPDDTRAVVGKPDALADPASVDFLLSMDFIEAAQMADQSMVLPPLFRVAANNISHPILPPGQNLTEFTATGNIFLEINFAEPLITLAQEADVTIQQIILRGRPVLKRGHSVIEATSHDTVFYVTADSIEIDGPHQLRRLGDRMPGTAPALPFPPAADLPTGPASPGPPSAITIDPNEVPEDMTAEEIRRLISGEE